MITLPQLRAETEGGIRWLIADSPARMNAYTEAMWAALPGLIRHPLRPE